MRARDVLDELTMEVQADTCRYQFSLKPLRALNRATTTVIVHLLSFDGDCGRT